MVVICFNSHIFNVFQLRPRSTHEHDEYLDKSSQSFDCEPSPPVAHKQGGSYTNLFNAGINQHNPTSVGAAIQASAHANHSKRPTSPPAQSRNTFERPAGKSGSYNVQNGGSLGRHKAPIVKEEDDTKLHSEGDDGPTSINSPSVKRSTSSSGPNIQSPNLERTLPPRMPPSKPSPRVNSPLSQRGDGNSGRPPHPPHSPSPSRAGTRDPGVSVLPSVSPIKDRGRNFYPSRSRENLNRSRENLNRSGDTLPGRRGSADYLSNSRDRLGGSRDQLSNSGDRPDGRYNTSERTRGDASPRDGALNSRSRDKAGSRDYDDRSRTSDSRSRDSSDGRHNSRDRYYREESSSRHGDKDSFQSGSSPRRSSESHPRERSSSRDTHRSRERDRSKSFELLDSSRERAGSQDRLGGRDRSLSRNLPETSQTGYGISGSSTSGSSYQPTHAPPTFSGYQPLPSTSIGGGGLGQPSGASTVSSGSSPRTLTFTHSSNAHQTVHQSSNVPSSLGPPSSNISFTSSHLPSQSSSSSLQQQENRPMSFVRALQVSNAVEIRDKRISERLRRQSQSSRKENVKSVYDTYEASV